MPTYIDGIGASENLDSSGERIIIAGLDISSLDKDGIFNYEHKSDQPSQIVGKVLKARKIFSDKDCEDERQSYYWQKVQVPFLYVMGELFDDYKDSAKDVAGMFRYDAAKRGQNERNVMNFSVEGAKIAKEGMDIVRSIARKITITVLPCNKMAIAEMVPAAGGKQKDDLDGIFKTESPVEVELLKFEDPMALLNMLKKRETPEQHAAKLGIKPMKKENGISMGGASTALSGVGPSSAGGVLGGEGMMRSEPKGPKHRTGTGVTVKDQGKPLPKLPGTTGAFEKPPAPASPKKQSTKPSLSIVKPASSPAAPTAARPTPSPVHTPASSKLFDPRLSGTKKSESMNKGKNNIQESPYPGAKYKGNLDVSRQKGVHKPVSGGPIGESGMNPNIQRDIGGSSKELHSKVLGEMRAQPKPSLPKSENMSKALDAGSSNAAPGALSGGAALGKESLSSKKHNVTMKKKSQWLARAEQEYQRWEKREQFEQFMAKKLPHLHRGEIQAIGQTIALSKALKAEKALKKISDAQNFQHSYVAKKETK